MKSSILTIMILFLLLFSFSGCTPKTVFVKELICINQSKLEPLENVQIRIHKDDLEVATEYKNEIDTRFKFYENQVDMNNKICKKVENE